MLDGNFGLLEVGLELSQMYDRCCYMVCQYIESDELIDVEVVVDDKLCVDLYCGDGDEFIDEINFIMGYCVQCRSMEVG